MKKADGQPIKNKDQSKNEKLGKQFVDTLVVGSGPAGLMKVFELNQGGGAAEPFAMVESQEHLAGRSSAGLHLLDASVGEQPFIRLGTTFGSAKIRWERKWVSFSEVDWTDSDWLACLPQWNLYLKGSKREFLGLSPDLLAIESENFVHVKTPVSSLEMLTDVAEYKWKALTAKGSFYCKKVIWAAGIPAFQNAFGKVEAQQYFEGNPVYQKDAADFVGGLSLEIECPTKPVFEEGFDESSVFAIPVRHESKFSLLIGILSPHLVAGPESSSTVWTLKTLTHVHHEFLSDPKELLSFQKLVRRAIKHVLSPESQESFEKLPERWVVSPKVGGHMLGNAWCFGAGLPDSLEFVGDQTLASLKLGCFDLSGLLTQKTEEIPAESQPNI
jgi:hypothetical protein